MKIEIHESRDSDVIAKLNQTVQNLHVKEYPQYFKEYDYNSVKVVIDELLSKDNWFSFIAYWNAEPVGYVLFYIRHYQENTFRYAYKAIHIDQISVSRKYQRTNIGTLLMDRVEEFASEKKIDQIELTYWDRNIHAKKFYEKRGFVSNFHFVVKQC